MSVNSTVVAGSPPKALTLAEIHRRLESCPPIPSLKSIQGALRELLAAGEFGSLRAGTFRDQS
jgi:hypothetical protein